MSQQKTEAFNFVVHIANVTQLNMARCATIVVALIAFYVVIKSFRSIQN